MNNTMPVSFVPGKKKAFSPLCPFNFILPGLWEGIEIGDMEQVAKNPVPQSIISAGYTTVRSVDRHVRVSYIFNLVFSNFNHNL